MQTSSRPPSWVLSKFNYFMPTLLLSDCQIWWRYLKSRPNYITSEGFLIRLFDLELWPWPIGKVNGENRHRFFYFITTNVTTHERTNQPTNKQTNKHAWWLYLLAEVTIQQHRVARRPVKYVFVRCFITCTWHAYSAIHSLGRYVHCGPGHVYSQHCSESAKRSLLYIFF